MFSFQGQKYFRIFIYAAAIITTAGSLWYSNGLVQTLAKEEEQRVKLYAEAMEFLGEVEDDCETNFVFSKITKNNEIIPVLLVNSDGVIQAALNVGPDSIPPLTDTAATAAYQDEIYEYFADLKARRSHEPIEYESYGTKFYVYYDESTILKQLRIYPYLQFVVIAVFFIVIFVSFSVAKKNEQNKVWVGLAKETAHQLGTPVSSLMAWMELLKLKLNETESDREIVAELQKDVVRLQTITERFSKIGSVPELNPIPIGDVLHNSAEYIRKRMSKKVQLHVNNEVPQDRTIDINPPLFEWVIENLLKNALDAIGNNEGRLTIHARESNKEYYIDVEDSGKGIPKSDFQTVFKPGFTTKKRGWGLGLSLTKRIVENYHKGKIFVKSSELGKGTIFRVVMPKG